MASCCKKSCENKGLEKTESKTSRLTQGLIFLCLLPIRFYRYFISPMLGPKCRFEPTCSHYAEIAIKKHGPFIGMFLAVKRILKCHPWHPGGYDPVPVSKDSSK